MSKTYQLELSQEEIAAIYILTGKCCSNNTITFNLYFKFQHHFNFKMGNYGNFGPTIKLTSEKISELVKETFKRKQRTLDTLTWGTTFFLTEDGTSSFTLEEKIFHACNLFKVFDEDKKSYIWSGVVSVWVD